MDSSSLSSMSNSSDDEEPEFVTNGNDLLEAFERCNFSLEDFTYPCHDVYTEYISLRKISLQFDQERYHGLEEEMEKRVVCYLLGRTYRGPTLRVVISSPTWLEPICVGLTENPTEVITSLHILFLGSDVLMGDSLQHIAPFLAGRSPSARGLELHISSSESEHILVGYGLHIAEAVRTNKLSMLDMSNIAANPRATESDQVAEALIENTSIYHLMVQATSPILNSFVWEDSKAANHYVEALTLVFAERVDFPELEAVLTTNQKLQDIRLLNAHFSQSMWLRIINSLEANVGLKMLDLGSSTGWIHKEVLSALLNRVRNCTQITNLGLYDLSEDVVRDNDILKEALPALNEQLRLNMEYGHRLRNAPSGPPRSARIVFCGPGYAGKTTFCKTMMRNESWLRGRIALFLQKRPKVLRSLYGPEAVKELHKRTKGVDMHVWQDQEDLRISLWDFAGEKECYALHDYLFPNVNSATLFLFFFSLAPSPVDTSGPSADVSARLSGIERELLFWLRFLCSNSNAAIYPKPRVRVIITGHDRVDASKHTPAHASVHQWPINGILRNFKAQFWDRLDLVEPAMFLNAHSVEMVTKVENQIRHDFRYMVPKLESTYSICEVVRRKLEEHMTSTPVITLDQYDKICLQVNEELLRSYHTRQAVASYLHNVGEIIYFKSIKFIVIDPRWLGVGVLGNLLGVFGRRAQTKTKGAISCSFRKTSKSQDRRYLDNGFMNREGLRTLLLDSLQSVTRSTGISPDDFIELLSALEICYKDDDRGGYLIPAALNDVEEMAARGIRELEWYTIADNRPVDCTFIGRRLQCADQDRTILTPGFFPRVQVVIRKYLEEQKIVGEQGLGSFEIDRNLLRFTHNAMDIIIEYGEGEQYRGAFVDVLVRTSQVHESTVDFIQKHVLNVIRKFCAQPEGNQGVILVEGIIRPKSVEHLVLLKDRENQAMLISVLEGYLKDDVSRRFFWNAVPGYVNRPGIDLGNPEEEYALDAINGQGFHDELKRHQTAKVKALSRKVAKLKEPLRIILESPIRQKAWLDTPKFVYILEDVTVLPFSSSRSEVRLLLHLGCEQKGKPHILTNQRGRPFVVEGEVRQTLMPLLQWAYKLLKLAGVAVSKSALFGAALEVGVGMLPSQVPPPSPAHLEKMKKRDREEIIRSYEEILMESPCCEWLIKFLDVEGKPEKFERDFSLRNVRYKDTQRSAFLCESCRIDGIARNILQPP